MPLVVLPLLLLCGLGPAAATAGSPATHTVVIEGMRFVPEVLTVKAGDTVVWVNRDLFPHTATAESDAFDSGLIAADSSWRHTPAAQGEFPYVCTYHPTMTGTLRVEGGIDRRPPAATMRPRGRATAGST
ncbi:MAG TPA: cupredoxin family copper-binding protein [Methylomirabilota bacterium]